MLPAINNTINLFTYSKNVDNEMIISIENAITTARKMKVQNNDNQIFGVSIYKYFKKIDLSTFMYLVQTYNFRKPEIATSYYGANLIYFQTDLELPTKTEGVSARIRLESTETKIELMPNDIKQMLNIS